MSKEELVSQLTALVEGYTDGLVSANCRLINSGYKLKEEKQEWAQKYHMVMADNKGLEEQNGILQEKAASLATLNETLSTESQNWQGQCAELQGQYSSVLKELAEKESSWSKALAAAEERYEDLTAWKEEIENVLDSMVEKLKDYETTSKVYEETIEMLTKQKGELEAQLEALKQINSFQEHRIEVLSRKARKLQKKEQND